MYAVTARHDMRMLAVRDAIDAYKAAYDEGRIERRSGASGYPPALDALVKGVPDASDADGRRLYFLRRLPRDPGQRRPPSLVPSPPSRPR